MNPEIGDVPGEESRVALTPVHREPGVALRLRTMMFIVGVCAINLWLVVLLGWWYVAAAGLLLLATAVGLVVILLRRSGAQKESMLWAMAIASRRSLPLADAVLAFSDQYGWIYRRRAQFLAMLLQEGMPLPEAVSRAPGAVTREAEVLIRVGDACGNLPDALQQAASLRTNRDSAWGQTASRFAYLGGSLMTLQLITAFIMYFIIPKFEAIFKDFGVSLPWVTVLAINVTHAMVNYFFIVFPLFFIVEVVIPIVLIVGMMNSYGLWMDVPLVDSLFRRRHSALIMRALALAVEGRKPVQTAIEAMNRSYPSAWVRNRLGWVGEDVRKGRDWIEALREAGLIRPAEAAVLDSAQRVGNLAWAFRAAADVSEKRLGYRFKFWVQMLFPVLIFSLGSVVALFAVAYFLPLVRLIEALAR